MDRRDGRKIVTELDGRYGFLTLPRSPTSRVPAVFAKEQNRDRGAERRLVTLLGDVDRVLAAVRRALAALSTEAPVVVLAANAGVLPLLANFLCAAKRRAVFGAAFADRVLLFAADEATETFARRLGLRAVVRDAALGAFPPDFVEYGSDAFARIAWLTVWNPNRFKIPST